MEDRPNLLRIACAVNFAGSKPCAGIGVAAMVRNVPLILTGLLAVRQRRQNLMVTLSWS